MPAEPVPSIQEWLDRLEMYRGSCIRPDPDRDIPADVAAYNEARRRATAHRRAGGRVTAWLFPEAEAEL